MIINGLLLLGAFVFCVGYSSAPHTPVHTPVQTPRATAESSEVLKNFTPGDLLYGLQLYRDPYLQPILRKTGYKFCTVDRFNNKFTPQLMDHNEKFSMVKYQAFKAEVTHPEQKTLDPQITAYMVTIMDDAIAKKEILDGMENEHVILWLCLKAIDYTVVNRHKIHFILDGIDVDEVFSRQFEAQGKGFTNTELKYICRNWQKLKHGIIFYYCAREVDAPWIQNPALWGKIIQ